MVGLPKDWIEMIRSIVEYLEHRNVKAKTGDVFPGDIAAVVASNRQLQPQPFAMEWGYHLSDGKRIINARSETARGRPCLPMVSASAGA